MTDEACVSGAVTPRVYTICLSLCFSTGRLTFSFVWFFNSALFPAETVIGQPCHPSFLCDGTGCTSCAQGAALIYSSAPLVGWSSGRWALCSLSWGVSVRSSASGVVHLHVGGNGRRRWPCWVLTLQLCIHNCPQKLQPQRPRCLLGRGWRLPGQPSYGLRGASCARSPSIVAWVWRAERLSFNLLTCKLSFRDVK